MCGDVASPTGNRYTIVPAIKAPFRVVLVQ